MTRQERRDKTARAESRRWLKWMDWESDRLFPSNRFKIRGYSDEPSYAFCLTSMGLTLLWWAMRVLSAARMRQWAIASHNCSCPMCRSHTRRHNGNSPRGQTIQERKQRAL